MIDDPPQFLPRERFPLSIRELLRISANDKKKRQDKGLSLGKRGRKE